MWLSFCSHSLRKRSCSTKNVVQTIKARLRVFHLCLFLPPPRPSVIKRGRKLTKDIKTPDVTDEPTLLWLIYAIAYRSASSTCDCSTKIWLSDFHQNNYGLEPLKMFWLLSRNPAVQHAGFSWVLSLGLLLSLTLPFDILGVNEESCFSFLRFIDVSPAEMANLMLQGLLARWEVCSLFDERSIRNKQGQRLNTVKVKYLMLYHLRGPLIFFLLLKINIFIRES